jgi:hypothetical protein
MDNGQLRIESVILFYDNGRLKGQKVGIIDGVEQKQRTVYDVVADAGTMLSAVPGQYPIAHFKDLPHAAALADRDKPTPIVTSNESLLYIGRRAD